MNLIVYDGKFFAFVFHEVQVGSWRERNKHNKDKDDFRSKLGFVSPKTLGYIGV